MKRRTFLGVLGAFLAAPLAFLKAKNPPAPSYLVDSDVWFLKDRPAEMLFVGDMVVRDDFGRTVIATAEDLTGNKIIGVWNGTRSVFSRKCM